MSMEFDISIEKYEKLSQLCRICLTENAERSKCLFDMHEITSIAEIVMQCSKAQIHSGDGFPEIICEQCLENLEVANSFRVKSENSDSLLRKFFINGVLTDHVGPVELPIDKPEEVKDEGEVLGDLLIKAEQENSLDCDDEYDDPLVRISSPNITEESNFKVFKKKHVKKKISSQTKIKITKILNKPKKKHSDGVENIVLDIPPRDEIDGKLLADECVESLGKLLETKVLRKQNVKPKTFECHICGRPLRSKKSLENHLHCIHTEAKKMRMGTITGYGVNKTYHCSECPYTTHRRQTLQYHTRVHTGERPYHCDVCTSSFSQPGSLESHKRSHSDKMYYTCPECGKQFKLKQRYERHKRVHSTLLLFTCGICDKGLKTKDSLAKHLNRHLNIRNYNCEQCGSRFVTLEELINHSGMHSETKKFQCQFCEFKTRRKKALAGHLLRHTKERNFKCDLCDYMAYDTHSITRHMTKHTREKKFSCPVCHMKMIHSSSVNKHMLRLHGIHYKHSDYADRRKVK